VTRADEDEVGRVAAVVAEAVQPEFLRMMVMRRRQCRKHLDNRLAGKEQVAREGREGGGAEEGVEAVDRE
jgi:hypothetical protein